jgi:hypothetical protein
MTMMMVPSACDYAFPSERNLPSWHSMKFSQLAVSFVIALWYEAHD